MKMTLVRMIDTKEPVMAIDYVEDLVLLGATVDELADPALCEYLDISIEIPIQIRYGQNMQWNKADSDEKTDMIGNPNLGVDMVDALEKGFKSRKQWIAFPESFDFLSIDRDDRIIHPIDIF